MNLTGMLKQLKKKLRSRRRLLSLGLWLILVGLTGWLAANMIYRPERPQALPAAAVTEPRAADAFESRIQELGPKIRVTLVTKYVCGEETRILGSYSPDQVLLMKSKHPGWTPIIKNGSVTFTEHIEDLSPDCKENAYFGVDQDGNLTLFEGLPQWKNVIRTFFQLNVQYLESSLPKETFKELQRGIRITDLAEYNSVLSTFSDFAVEETEKAMQQKDGGELVE